MVWGTFFSCSMWALWLLHVNSWCGMWALVPWPEIHPGPPALGAWNLSHWTTDWLGLLAAWRSLKSLLQNHSSKHQFFGTQSSLWSNSHIRISSVAQSYPTLCDPVNHSMPGLPVHHQLPKSTQTHVHCVSDAIQPSHPLSSPSPPALNLSKHQGLFQWVNSLHEVAKVLESQLQHQSFQWTPRTDLL